MHRKTTVPARFDFDFTDSEEEEDDEEELVMKPPPPSSSSSPPSPHHHAITPGVAGAIAVETDHDGKTTDNQDATSPVDTVDNHEQEKKKPEKYHHAGAIVAGAAIIGGVVAKKHHDDNVEEKVNDPDHDEKTTDNQDSTSPVDTVADHKQEKENHDGHHHSRPIIGTVYVGGAAIGGTIAKKKSKHDEDKKMEESKPDEQDITPPVDTVDNNKQEKENHDGHHHAGPLVGTLIGAAAVSVGGTLIIKSKHDKDKKTEESKPDEQDITPPVDTVDNHEQEKKKPDVHHHTAAIVGGSINTIGVIGGAIAYKKHHDKTEEAKPDEQDTTTPADTVDDHEQEETTQDQHHKSAIVGGALAVGTVVAGAAALESSVEHKSKYDADTKVDEPKPNEHDTTTPVDTGGTHKQEKENHHHPPAIVVGAIAAGIVGTGAVVSADGHKSNDDADSKVGETKEQDTTPPVDTVDNPEQENKETRRHYFHRHRNHPHHPHLGAIADHVSSAVGAIASGIGIKPHHHKNPKTVSDLSPSPSASSIAVATAIPPEPPQFEIVLVNIKKTVEEGHIHCEKKLLDGASPYVALSYRWGELDEQIVPATKDYYARIVSFRLDDFFKLCQAMRQEPDLKDIEYVWVDAICVDQENMEKRKATIYRMNDIYIHSAAIVAVPDLHAYHIATTTTANSAIMDTIEGYRRYLYYLLVGTPEAQQSLVEIDNAWMDKLGMPTSDAQRRDLILSATSATTNHLGRGISSLPFTQQLMTLMANPGGMMMASTVDALKVKDNNDIQDRELPSRMIMEAQRFEWQQQLNQRQTDICQSVQFLQSIMEDWSNRTWVISEYHIAKKLTGKLKFWYNQLSCPELYGQRFFEFKFKSRSKKKREVERERDIKAASAMAIQLKPYPYTKQIIDLTSHFNTSMVQRLSSRTVLEMMLQTKASKVEDRFHAIIPLAKKYKRFIKDRQSISKLGVSDMLSVRLKLMEWSDTKDRLLLLFSEHAPTISAFPFLPTYATHFKAIPPGLSTLLDNNPSQCNFGIHAEKEEEENEQQNDGDDDDDNQGDTNNKKNDDGSVRLVRTGTFNELWLSPRMYCERQVHPQGKSSFHNLWHDLGIDPTRDRLDAVSIPLFINMDEMEEEKKNSLVTLDLQLLGSWEKNIWIIYPFDPTVKETKMCPMESQKQKLPKGFRVY